MLGKQTCSFLERVLALITSYVFHMVSVYDRHKGACKECRICLVSRFSSFLIPWIMASLYLNIDLIEYFIN